MTDLKNTSGGNVQEETLGMIGKLKKILNRILNGKKEDAEIEFMPPVIAAIHRQRAQKAPRLLAVIASFFVIFIVWASLAEVDEVARGDGKIIPSSQIQKVSHLEGGIVEGILVKEGDMVEKGQVLLKIDPTIVGARLQGGRDLYYRYLAAAERLKAQVEWRDYIVPAIVLEKAPAVAEEEMDRFKSRKQKIAQDVAIAEHEVSQKTQELRELQGKHTQLKSEFELASQEISMTEPLVKQGLSAKLDFLKLKRDVSDLKGRLDSTEVNIARAEAALQQAREKLTQVPIIARNEDFAELRDMNAKLSNAQETFTSEGDRATRTEVRSPVRGIIKQLLITTVGSVAKPGENLIEVVPIEDTLLVEVHIKPADIAYVRPGLPATVKITAYDYSIYGGLDGKVVLISADTIENEKDPKRETFYKVTVRTSGTQLTKNSDVVKIIPGLVASVDIKTGKKTIMHYLLKPLIKAKDTALREH